MAREASEREPGDDDQNARDDRDEEEGYIDVVAEDRNRTRKRQRKTRATVVIKGGKRRNVSFCPNKSANSNTSLSRSRRSLKVCIVLFSNVLVGLT